MTILSIRKFNGEIPQLPADRLPQDAAQYAKNCDFTAQELRPLKGIGTHYTAAAGARPVRALFTDDGLRFFAWNKPTRAYLHPTIDDTVGRVIYHKHGEKLKVALVSGMTTINASPGEPASSFDVGVTAPAAPVVVAGGVVASDTQGVFARSTDGLTWTAATESPLGAESVTAAVTVSGSDVVFGNAGGAYRSSDGVTWTASATYPMSGGKSVVSAAGVGSTVVAVGQSGLVSTSGDGGVTWLIRTSGVGENLNKVAVSPSLFVAVGNAGKILTSADGGASWASRGNGFGASAVLGVEYLGSLYLAFGENGKLATSTDGASWSDRTSGFGTTNIRAATRAALKWVLAGDGGKITNSDDGVTWIERASPFSGSSVRKLQYASGVAMGLSVSGALARSSDDGDTWVSVSLATAHDVLYASGKWIAVTASGIYTSADGVTWVLRSSLAYGALALSESGRVYAIESSTTASVTAPTLESISVVAVAINVWGEESAPSDPVTFEKESGQSVVYNVTHTPTAGQQALQGIVFYRTYPANTSTDYFLLNKTPAALVAGVATFEDVTTEPVTATALVSAAWSPPPAAPSNLTYVGNGFFVVGSGKDLVFSEPYKPHAWPYRMTLPHGVVGIVAIEGGILVTTQAQTYLASGAHPAQVSQQLLPVEQAGWTDTAMTRVEGSAVFASNDGVVSVSGGQPSLKESQALFRRRDWRAKYGNARLNLRMAHHDGYLLGLVDPSYPTVRTEEPFLLKLDEAAGSYCRLDAGQPLYGAAVSGTTDQLFVTTATGFAEFAAGDALSYVWWSGDRLFQTLVNFSAGVVDADPITGTATLQIYADGELRHIQHISGRTSFRLFSGPSAYRWSIQINGTATIREISLGASFAELKGA